MPPFCPAVEWSQPLMLVGNKMDLRPGLAERVHTEKRQLAMVSSSSSGPRGNQGPTDTPRPTAACSARPAPRTATGVVEGSAASGPVRSPSCRGIRRCAVGSG